MTRGTTPTLILRLPREIDFDTLYLTFNQGEQTILEKTLEDVEIEGAEIILPLSQEDTLALTASVTVDFQLRGKVGAMAYASKIKRLSVGRILKDGEI